MDDVRFQHDLQQMEESGVPKPILLSVFIIFLFSFVINIIFEHFLDEDNL